MLNFEHQVKRAKAARQLKKKMQPLKPLKMPGDKDEFRIKANGHLVAVWHVSTKANKLLELLKNSSLDIETEIEHIRRSKEGLEVFRKVTK